METLLLTFINGLTFGALLFLLASGFTLIFGLMRVANLAHGALYLIGGYLGLTTLGATGSFWLAAAAAGLGVGVLGLTMDRTLLRFVRGKELPEVLMTVGVALVLAEAAIVIWGGDVETLSPPSSLSGSVELAGLDYSTFRLSLVGFGALVAAALLVVQRKTKIGAILRAGVDDGEMLSGLGVNLRPVFAATFFIGSVLAGIAGVIGGVLLGLYPGADLEILLLSLVVVIIGGLGSLEGAAAGSIVVGLLDSFGRTFVPELSYFVVFGPMILVLIVRPQGLFGRAA